MTVNNRIWNLALLQMDIAIGEPELNYAKLEKLLDQAVEGETKPDVIIFPEMWNTGYALDRIQELADEEGQRTHALLSEFSRKHQVNIIGGLLPRSRAARYTIRFMRTIVRAAA